MLQTPAAEQKREHKAAGIDAGKGLRFRTGRQVLRFLRSRSEEALCRERDAAAGLHDEATEDAAAAVDAAVLELMDAWNRHNTQAWAACFTQDADYVDSFGAHWEGRAEIEARQAEGCAAEVCPTVVRISEWTIRFLSAEACLVHVSWKMKGGPARKGRGLLSLVLVPDHGRWRVTAAHNSDSFSVLS